MEQIDKLKEEFDKEFGPKTIWVVPSKENIETIKDIWSWIIQNFTPKEEVKKIDMKNKPMTKREEQRQGYSNFLSLIWLLAKINYRNKKLIVKTDMIITLPTKWL